MTVQMLMQEYETFIDNKNGGTFHMELIVMSTDGKKFKIHMKEDGKLWSANPQSMDKAKLDTIIATYGFVLKQK